METTYNWLNSFEDFKERIEELMDEEGYKVEWEERDGEDNDYMEDILWFFERMMEVEDLSEEGAFSQTIENLIKKKYDKKTKTFKDLGWYNFNDAIGEGLWWNNEKYKQ